MLKSAALASSATKTAEGAKQAKIAVAKNLLKAGISTDIISQTTGFSHSEISQLKEKA